MSDKTITTQEKLQKMVRDNPVNSEQYLKALAALEARERYEKALSEAENV